MHKPKTKPEGLSMKVHEPYVKMLGKMDYRKEAWKTSRPKFTEENLHFDKIADMDLSLNSMLVYTLEIRSSVIFRDLLFSLRPMEGWALSTRSMPINRDTVCLSAEFEGAHGEQEKIDAMFNKLENGESRDSARGVLPCTVSSTYTLTIDFRVLMSFCKTIKEKCPRLFKLYCVSMLDATGTTKDFENTTVKSAYEYYAIQPAERIAGVTKAGNMIIGNYTMKYALAAQFLRQHYSKIKISLWTDIENYFNLNLSQDSLVEVAFYIDANSYSRLMSMRSHWVIDWSYDMWGAIVGDYIDEMSTKEFWEFIPNGGGKEDPYWADVYNRVLLEDPGLPCPIMCEWPEMIARKKLEVGDSILMRKYEALAEEGYINDNPENEHRKKYLSLGGK